MIHREVPVDRSAKLATGVKQTPQQNTQGSFFRVVWRWHFYAGVIVAPVLLVVALTGSLYVFKDEIEGITNAEWKTVAVESSQVSLEKQLMAASAALPDGKLDRVELGSNPTQSNVFRFKGKEGQSWMVYVNPYSGKVLGQESNKSGFFEVVLKIHRQLFIGTTGKVIVELTTSWTLILVLTGIYLWWPRRRDKHRGVWWPRLKAKLYTVLRDFHAMAGVAFSLLILLIGGTGLFWSLLWGQGFKSISAALEQSPQTALAIPKLEAATPDRLVTLDEMAQKGAEYWPNQSLSISVPQTPLDPLVVRARPQSGPTFAGQAAIHQGTGALLKRVDYEDLPALAQLRVWVYPLHVGSVFGLPTKILAFCTTLVLMGLVITGIWMWMKRRPEGQPGFPKPSSAKVPWIVVGCIVGSSLFLPAVGISVLLILAGERVYRLNTNVNNKWNSSQENRDLS